MSVGAIFIADEAIFCGQLVECVGSLFGRVGLFHLSVGGIFVADEAIFCCQLVEVVVKWVGVVCFLCLAYCGSWMHCWLSGLFKCFGEHGFPGCQLVVSCACRCSRLTDCWVDSLRWLFE